MRSVPLIAEPSFMGNKMDTEKILKKIEQFCHNSTRVVSITPERKGSCMGQRNLPPFCRIKLESRPGQKSLIRSELWLPECWNGIFLGLGNGGMAGSIDYAGLAAHLKKGYATANTDMGTSRGRSSGIANPDVWMDFG